MSKTEVWTDMFTAYRERHSALRNMAIDRAKELAAEWAESDRMLALVGRKTPRFVTAWRWGQVPLGKVNDKDLSLVIGCSHEHLRRTRVEQGIPELGYCHDWELAEYLMDDFIDRELSEMMGVSLPSVWRKRQARKSRRMPPK